MANFLYPRTISISRTVYSSTAGGGLEPSANTIATGIAASIQLKRLKPLMTGAMGLPAASAANPGMSEWMIMFNLALGSVNKGDKITDDLGQTYEVEAPYWNSLGYQCECRIYKP